MLAREIDKARATLYGLPVMQPSENEALLDDAFFGTLGVTEDVLRDVVHQAWLECRKRNYEALIDLRESLASEPEISDAEFMDRAQASDIDHATVNWLFETLGLPAELIDVVNAQVERIAPLGDDGLGWK